MMGSKDGTIRETDARAAELWWYCQVLTLEESPKHDEMVPTPADGFAGRKETAVVTAMRLRLFGSSYKNASLASAQTKNRYTILRTLLVFPCFGC